MTGSTTWCTFLIGALSIAAIACNDQNDPVGPTVSGNPTPPAPVVSSIALTGNVLLSAVGETSQLTLTASFSDGTTKDVTREGRWTIGDARVLTFSPDGLITIVGLGRTFVSATYANKNALSRVTATPPGTYVISGRVREPGQGGVLDATVVDRATGLSGVANRDGLFSLASLPAQEARVGVIMNGYEPREFDASSSTDLDAPIQRIVRVTAGDVVEPAALAPNDLAYVIDGVVCQPCRMIRIEVPSTGDMQMVLTWQTPPRLTLFAGGMRVTSDSGSAEGFLTIPAPRELVVYVGADSARDHTKFKLSTTRPGN